MSDAAPASPKPRSPALEPWALGALLGAIFLGWCPLGGLAAIVAAAIALRRIRASDGARGGARMAWVAMALAAAIMLLEGWAFERFAQQVQDDMELQTIDSIEATLRGEAGSVAQWDPGAAGRPDAAGVAAFARRLEEQHGRLRRVTITNRTADSVVDPHLTIAFNADFERGTALGKAVFAPLRATLPPVLRLEAVEVESGGQRQSPVPAEGQP